MGDGEEASGGGSRKKGRQNTNALFLVSTKTGEVRLKPPGTLKFKSAQNLQRDVPFITLSPSVLPANAILRTML